SEYRHELELDIEPFKGLLLGLFFIAVGMSVDLGLFVRTPFLVLGLALGVVALKIVLLYPISILFGYCGRADATLFALALSQVGEFAFVLFGVAASQSLLNRETVDLLNAVVAASMVATPLLMLLWERVLAPRLTSRAPRAPDAIAERNPVIIAGFGRFGQIVGRILATRGIPFTALDSDSEQLDFVTQFGEKAYFGDASRLDLLRAARADKASVLVIAIDDIEASMKCAAIAKQHFPHIKIFARARNRLHAYQLLDLGITRVWREMFHASADMAGRVLGALGVPDSTAEETVRIFTMHDERLIRRAAAHHADMPKLIEIAKAGRAELRSLFEQDRR
ncbi:MAG: NAD-binding protein, partial [Myxococcota bacterium]